MRAPINQDNSESGEDSGLINGWWWRRLLPLMVWVGIILWIASRPKAAFFSADVKMILGMPRDWLQYPYHFGVFFILAILFRRCLSPTANHLAMAKTAGLSILGCALVSVCSEGLQFYVPARTPAIRDLVLDQSGTLFAITLMRHFPRIVG
jgi:hypothetical protein